MDREDDLGFFKAIMIALPLSAVIWTGIYYIVAWWL